jgi:hypothetical protein
VRQLLRRNSPFSISTRRESSRRTINPFVRVPLLFQLRLHVGRVTADVLCDDRVRAAQAYVKWVRIA